MNENNVTETSVKAASVSNAAVTSSKPNFEINFILTSHNTSESGLTILHRDTGVQIS